VKTGEVSAAFLLHFCNQGFERDALFLRLQHDRRAACIVGADIVAAVTAQALKPGPDIRLART